MSRSSPLSSGQIDKWKKLSQDFFSAMKPIEERFEEFTKSVEQKDILDEFEPTQHFSSHYLMPESCMHGYEVDQYLGNGVRGIVFLACPPRGAGEGKEPRQCNLVWKVESLDSLSSVCRWKEEVKVATRMGELEVGPKVTDHFICDGVLERTNEMADSADCGDFPETKSRSRIIYHSVGVIVMEKLDEVLFWWLDKNIDSFNFESLRKTILDQVEKKLRLLYAETGKMQFDIHIGNNLMVKLIALPTSQSSTSSGHPAQYQYAPQVFVIDFGDESLKRYEPEKAEEHIRKILKDIDNVMWRIKNDAWRIARATPTTTTLPAPTPAVAVSTAPTSAYDDAVNYYYDDDK